MAPGYRTTATNTRRGNRSGFAEHDDFEGLPVRQWRQQMVTVAPPPEREENKKHDRWAQELPHGMPRDTHLLTPHNQELLRLARSGKLYRKRPLPEEEDADADAIAGDKQDKKDPTASNGYSFKVRKWVRLERSAEDAGVNYLAKREKGTITLPSRKLGTQITGPMVTKATVKRVDAAGNPYTQEVTITDGQTVDGEIISTSVVPAPEATSLAASSGATPVRRKPPIPQKKKGRGRGRGGRGRGRLPLATSTSTSTSTSTRPMPQQDGATEIKSENVGPDGVKIETEDLARNGGGDVEMNESSALDDDDGDEGSGDDDDEGDGDESGTPAAEGEDQEMKDAPSYTASEPAAEALPATPTEAPQPGATLAPPPLVTDPTQLEGSPLKNVTLQSPMDPSPRLSPIAATAVASTDAGLSEVPGESTLGLQPSAPEPQQSMLLSQAFFKNLSVDSQHAEQVAPAPAETAPATSIGMANTTSTVGDMKITSPELTSHQPIVPFVADNPATGVEPATHTEELPTGPLKEDVPLESSERPMPGQVLDSSEQQAHPGTEPAPPSPIIAPVSPPLPAPSPLEQVPSKDETGNIRVGDAAVNDISAQDSGIGNAAGADYKETEKAGVQGAGAKDTAAEHTGVEHTGADEVGTEDVATEIGTEDGSFDILGSLSTSLNQQAEEDAPPTSLPSGPAGALPAQSAEPAQVGETAQATGIEKAAGTDQVVETSETAEAQVQTKENPEENYEKSEEKKPVEKAEEKVQTPEVEI